MFEVSEPHETAFPNHLGSVSHWPNAFFGNENLNMVSVYCVNLLEILQYHRNLEDFDWILSHDKVHHMIHICRDFLALKMAIQRLLAHLERHDVQIARRRSCGT